MAVYKETIEVKSHGKTPTYIDITKDVRRVIEESGIKNGICAVISPHTTCSVFFEEFCHDYNEDGDEFLQEDLNNVLAKIKEAGAEALFLNHAENPKTVSDLYATIKRAKELDMITVVCADSTVEAKAVACMDPDIVLAEPTDLIGTGQVADDSYTIETVKALNAINPNVLVMIASGVSTAEDCYNVVKLGADGTGATSGILNEPSPAQRVREMAEAIVKAKNEK